MIPQRVYDFVKFGNGASPNADMRTSRGMYALERDWDTDRVTCKFYPNNWTELSQVKQVSLRDVPNSTESDWRMYWTNEC